MSLVVPRSVTVVDGGQSRSAPLTEFRSDRAYVLLGDPGAGKTEAFKSERDAHPDSELVTARHFISRSLDRHPECNAETLFIDGLDEVRAGRPDARRPMDRILTRLAHLGSPNFRLSCRAADWLGRNDLEEIVSTAGYENVRVLHLEPLRDEDIQSILADLGVPEPDRFLAQASERSLDGLLGNPHSLELLVKAVGHDEWPRDRRTTFEMACRTLARERNDQDNAVHRSAPLLSLDRIMAAAGHLSALLLLSDKEQVSIDPSENPDNLCLEDVPDGDQPALLRALKSNLFSGRPDGSFVPPHRQLAEFLGARFLHTRIDSGVPANRVLALMTGEDGVVVTELRGLSAWLAACDRPSRLALIETDPVGIALYGDVGGFRSEELENLLRAFAERADEIKAWSWPSLALASLIGDHTVQVLARLLSDEDRTDGRQAIVGLLLRGLARAQGTRPSLDRLEEATRDATWQPWVRQSALRALIHHSRNREDRIPSLMALLDDLRDGRVEDRDGELLGRLLSHVYPLHVTPERIWDYWRPLGVSAAGGSYGLFWSPRLLNETNARDVVALVQALVRQGREFRAHLSDDGYGGIVLPLVRQALAAGRKDTPIATIYDWLELMDFDKFGSARMRTAEYRAVSGWLGGQPELQKELALEGLSRQLRPDDPEAHANRFHRAWVVWSTVFGGRVPDDFAEWCLHQAVEAAETRLHVAFALLEWSRPWREGESGPGLSIEDVRAATRGVPALRGEIERLLSPPQESKELPRLREEGREYRQERRREKAEFIAQVQEHVGELREGRCAPGLLHHIAQAYHDFYRRQRLATPLMRVTELLDGNADLAEAAIEGFRRVTERRDLPTLREIIRLDERGRMSSFALPLLAGLAEMASESVAARNPTEIARAAGFYYLTPLNVEGHPEWYRRALEHHPQAVVNALIKVTRSRIRGRRDCPHLWRLARESSHRTVARLAVPRLFRAFPTRCTEPQVSALYDVLLAALRWRTDGLKNIVREKIGKPNLDVSQRALWLAAGLFLWPEIHVPHIVAFLEDGEEARAQQVIRLLGARELKRASMSWGSGELKSMIELLGSRYSPWRPASTGIAYSVDENRLKVEGLIARWATTLASRTDCDACDALQSLVDNRALEPWHLRLSAERDQQVVARRNATFAVPDLFAVQRTLANEEPANPADLAALVADRLEFLSTRIRHGNTDDWRQYWNEDSRGRPIRPKHEDSCRDALLSDLRQLLPSGMDAQPEGHYARDNRADIRVSFNGSAIPVEIKKDSHRKLWSAVADQLVGKYIIDPDSSGFGIYLVLWFGLRKVPVPPTGRRPDTPEALRQRLQEQLTGPFRHKIKVIVMDVSGSSYS